MLIEAGVGGTNTKTGEAVASQARQLEAVLWNQVLAGLSATAVPDGALGAGSDQFNSIAQDAVSQQLFSGIDQTLTQQIVRQATHGGSGAGEVSSASVATQSDMAAIRHGPMLLTLERMADGLIAAGGTMGNTMSREVTGLERQGAGSLGEAVSFAKQVWPSIVQAAGALKVPPVAVLAQAALETGWGASVPDNNMFGVKSTTGAGVNVPTQEEVNGNMVAETATFAAYPSVDAAAGSYADLVRSRYPEAVGASSVGQYASALAAGGWATDQAYAAKIVSVAQSPMMNDVLRMIGAGGTP